MKNLFLFILILFSKNTDAQFHEVSFGIGLANYYGDLSPLASDQSLFEPVTSFGIRSNKIGISAEYRYNFIKHFSVGLTLTHMSVAAKDSDNDSKQLYDKEFYRKIRNLSFYSNISEANVNLRYEPFRNEYKWDLDKFHLSPYVCLGVGVFKFNPMTEYKGEEYALQSLGTEGQGLPGQKDKYNLVQFSLPVTIGFKVTAPNRAVSFTLDASYRFTSTDYLDDVSTVYMDPAKFSTFNAVEEASIIKALAERRVEIDPSNQYAYITSTGQMRGNSNNNDAFVTVQARISFLIPTRGSKDYRCTRY